MPHLYMRSYLNYNLSPLADQGHGEETENQSDEGKGHTLVGGIAHLSDNPLGEQKLAKTGWIVSAMKESHEERGTHCTGGYLRRWSPECR